MKTYLKDLTPDEVIRRLNAGLAGTSGFMLAAALCLILSTKNRQQNIFVNVAER